MLGLFLMYVNKNSVKLWGCFWGLLLTNLRVRSFINKFKGQVFYYKVCISAF